MSALVDTSIWIEYLRNEKRLYMFMNFSTQEV